LREFVVGYFKNSVFMAKTEITKIRSYQLCATQQDINKFMLWEGSSRFFWNYAVGYLRSIRETSGLDDSFFNIDYYGYSYLSGTPFKESYINDKGKKKTRNVYPHTEKYSGGYNRWLTILKHSEYPWLSKTPVSILQELLRNLNSAMRRFYSEENQLMITKMLSTPGIDKHKAYNYGFPKFKSRNKSINGKMSFKFPKGTYTIKGDHIRFRGIKRPIRFIIDRPLPENITGAIITHDKLTRHCFVRFIYTELFEISDDPLNVITPVALDVGITRTIALSSGENDGYQLNTNLIREIENKISKFQKIVDNKQKGSNKHIKLSKRIAMLNRKLLDIRIDFYRKSNKDITSKHNVIFKEDLDIQNMTQSNSGTVENPGSDIQQKSNLNRAILRNGWYNLVNDLENRMKEKNGLVISVPPAYTSQTCPMCGYIDENNRSKNNKSLFKCLRCSFEKDADFIGAMNIYNRGVEHLNKNKEDIINKLKENFYESQLAKKEKHENNIKEIKEKKKLAKQNALG